MQSFHWIAGLTCGIIEETFSETNKTSLSASLSVSFLIDT